MIALGTVQDVGTCLGKKSVVSRPESLKPTGSGLAALGIREVFRHPTMSSKLRKDGCGISLISSS